MRAVCCLFGLAAALAGCAGDRLAERRESQTAYKLGIAFLSEGRAAPALRELTRAETLSPQDPEIANALGLAYWMKREYASAEAKLKSATALKPDFSEAWNNLAALYIDQGRYEETVEAAQKALSNVFYPTPERALAHLGLALSKLGRSAEAETKLRGAIELAPNFPLPEKFLGALLQERGDHREALRHLDRALEFLPSDQEIHLRRGVSLLKLGDRSGARQAFDQAARLAPESDLGRSAKNYLDLLE